MGSPRSRVVHGRLRSVHRGPASGRVGAVHGRSGSAVTRGAGVGGHGSLGVPADDGDAGPVDGDGLALGVELDTSRALGGILEKGDKVQSSPNRLLPFFHQSTFTLKKIPLVGQLVRDT